jgi:sarcosine oxidase subunit alpha
VATPTGLLKLTADRYVYATGAYEQNALFADNDRPGVLAARAVGRLLVRYRVRPGARPLVVGDGPYAHALAAALADAGCQVERIDGVATRLHAARGHAWVKGVEVEEAGKRRRIACDLVAVAALPSPASELPREHGAEVAFSPAAGGFACVTDEDGRTARAGVLAAGDVTGFVGPERAAELGRRVGERIA